MLHLWNYRTKKALGKGRMGAFTAPCSVLELSTNQWSGPQSRHGVGTENLLLDELLNYWEGTWKSCREGSSSRGTDTCSRVTCGHWGEGRYLSPKEGIVSGTSSSSICSWTCCGNLSVVQDIVLLQLGEREKDPLSPAGHILSCGITQESQGDVSYKDLIAPPCSPASAPRKVGSPYPHTPDWNVDSGCCWARAESTKPLNTTAKSAFARG